MALVSKSLLLVQQRINKGKRNSTRMMSRMKTIINKQQHSKVIIDQSLIILQLGQKCIYEIDKQEAPSRT